ncbi:MAG: glycosyltransferase family 2 protein [Pseudomonadota bacterium]
MTLKTPTWGTVTLADEPPELMLAFAAYHARLGASEIHIFLDRPNAGLGKKLLEIPGVMVTQCDTPFWVANGGRMPMQTRRQDVVANIGYAEAGVDWLIHMDADEFIYPVGDFGAELAAVPDAAIGMRIFPRERAWRAGVEPEGIFDGLMRVPLPGKLNLDRVLTGRMARFTQRGLTGHTQGKTILRTGKDLRLSIHAPHGRDKLDIMESQTARLLHFDGLTPFHWLFKRLRYASMPYAKTRRESENYRWNQITRLSGFKGIWKARQFQEQLTTLTPEAEAQLRALRLIEDTPGFDPRADAEALFSDEKLDFSAKAFDRYLRKREHELIEALKV